MKMTKKLLSIILTVVLLLSLLPADAFATDLEALLDGTVYISISDDAEFITALDGTPMGFYPVSLEELMIIDLEEWGLGDYTYDPDNDGIPEITALHLYIYVHELILGQDWSEVYITGGAGSTYFAGGLFGFSDENLRYDYNGAYPAVDGWGLTADQIVLSDGDFLNIAHYTSWAFWGDSATGFHYFTDAEGNLQHSYQVAAGEPLELGIVRSYSDWANGGSTAFDPEIGYEIYYGKTYGQPEGMVYADEEGMTEITFPSAGTWYVWANGGYGMENSMDIVSAPALATVKVPDLEFNLDLRDLTDPIYDGGIVIYDLDNPTEFAYIDDTCEAGDEVKFGFSVADYDQYIIYVDFYTDSNVLGWNVNGVNYFAEDPGDGYVDWELGNDIWAGYAFDYTDEDTNKKYIEFYFQLGADGAYNTPGSWDIQPILLTDKALEAIDAIDEIYANGEITLESGEVIRNAAALYNSLSDMEKEVLAYFEMTELLEEAQEIYNALQGDRAAADEVEDLITAIGIVDLTKETAITAARAAYDALTDTRKAMVGNYAALTAAEERLAQLKQEALDRAAADTVEEQINAIGAVTAFSDKKITAARAAYDALTDAQKAFVENASVLTAAESALTEAYKQAANADYKVIYEATASYIAGLGTPYVGSTGGEWLVIDLVRAGLPCPEGYYANVEAYVKENINDKEQLHRAKSTDNARVILALTAAGYDVTNVAGHNLLMGLTDMTYVPKQGINGPIWTLIAFDSHNYEIPANPDATEQVTREKLIAYILEKQLADGGWALSGQSADPDMTGMALQALAPYYKTNDAVKTAVDTALTCLSNKQLANGGFGSVDGICTESCAQVIVALTALGIDPETDSRFVKNGMSVVDAMCLFAVNGGGFAHIPGDSINGMATEQGQYALVSYFRFKENKTALYDMTDVVLPGEAVMEQIAALGTVTLDSKTAVEAARAAYDALSASQKTFVTNYETLTAAEATLKELQTAADKAAADKAAADAVAEKIAAIGTVTLESKTAVEAARTAYDALSDAQKALTSNYETLVAAETALKALQDAADKKTPEEETIDKDVTDQDTTNENVSDKDTTDKEVTDAETADKDTTDQDTTDPTVAGKVENITDVKGNAYSGNLEVPADELLDKLLTKEEQKLMQEGVNINIDLQIKDVSEDVPAADKALVEKSLDKHTVGLYLDITLTKQLGEAAPVKITETNDAVTVTITVPEQLRNTDAKVNRSYQVIRVHEGKADILNTVYDANTGKLSFETDAFSTYALVYTDTVVSDNPKTGDDFPTTLCTFLMIASAACMAVLSLNKKNYAK